VSSVVILHHRDHRVEQGSRMPPIEKSPAGRDSFLGIARIS
jgi:hypothetical protein